MKTSSLTLIFLITITLITGFSCAKKNEDNSMSVNEYMKLGVPDPSQEWDLDKCTQAYDVLMQMKWEKPSQLPRRDSEKSGILFKHMLSLSNMSFLKDSTKSLNEKAEHISAFVKVYDYWMDVYANPLFINYYNSEIIDIQIFNLGLCEAMVDLVHEINKSDDPADVALQYGYNSIKKNYTTCLNNDLKTQSNTSQFPEKDLDRMADSIYVSVMRNREWMDSTEVSELKQSLRLVMDSTSSDYIRNKYKSLEESL